MADLTDQAVTRAIQRVQDALDDLKALQSKDNTEDEQPKTLRAANAETRSRFAQARANRAGSSNNTQ